MSTATTADRNALHEETGGRPGARPAPQQVAGPGAPGRAGSRAATPEPLILTVTAHQAGNLPHWTPHLVQHVRHRLRQRSADAPPAVVIDLSAVPPTPACAPLLMLFRLVRRSVDPKSPVVVTGVNVALSACLVDELPTGVTLIDRRGRRWSR
jgi:hypothetical protein